MDKQRTYALRFEVKDGQIVKAEFQDIAKTGDKSMKTLSDRVKEAAKSLTTLKGAASALTALQAPLKFLSVAGGVLSTAFAWVTKNAYDWAGEIKDGALQANLAAEAFQELRYVAVMTGVEFETLTSSANKFFGLADEFVRTGGGAAADVFKAIGMSQKEVNAGLADGDKLFTQVMDQLRGLDKTSQINMAQKLFGREGGREFLKLLAESSTEVARLRQEARTLGLVLSEDMISKADEASDKIGAMAYILQTKVKVAIIENSDQIMKLIDGAIENLPDAIDKVTKFAEAIGLIDGRTAAEKLGDLNSEIDELEKKISEPSFIERLEDFRDKLYIKAGIDTSALGGDLQTHEDRNLAELEKLKQEKAELLAQIEGAKNQSNSTTSGSPDKAGSTRPQGYVNSGGGGKSDTERILERIKAMQQEIEVTKLSAREQAALRAEQSLGAKASEEQKKQARDLAIVLYDQSEATKKAEEATRKFESAADSVASTIEDTVGDALKGNLRTWEDWSDAILNIVGDVAQQMAILSGGGTGGSFTKSIAEGLLGAFGFGGTTAPAGRASGGPVSAGEIYRINEREAEYFAPDRSGRMIPVSKMPSAGGGGDMNVTIVNNAGAQVSTQARQAGGDRELLVMIDQATAQNMKNPGSSTSLAMQGVISPNVTKR